MSTTQLLLLICLCVYPFRTAAILLNNNACSDLQSYISDVVLPNSKCYRNPDVLLTVPEIVERNCYTISPYSVTTNDGYKLTLFRILSKEAPVKNSVFIQHGINSNSAVWVDIEDKSLAFNLVQMGYDVWLGNVRGTTYSRKHVTLDISNSDYWNFNLDTLIEDIRTQLHFVANKTGNGGDIIYIGHSMGTTLGFMYLSEYPNEAQSLVKGYVALAPIVYMDKVKSIDTIRPIVLPLLSILEKFQIKGLFYQEEIIHKTLNIICRFLPTVCYEFLTVTFGKTDQFLAKDLLLYYSNFPTGASIYQYKQYLQMSQSGKFQKYDFGPIENEKFYGTSEPPSYNLTKIQIPVWLLYGKTDTLYNEKNINRLFDDLGSGKKIKQPIPSTDDFSYFNHIDFLYAKNIKDLLYNHLFQVLNEEL